MTTEYVQLQLHRGTAAEFAAVDPVLSAGEVGVETDTGIMRVGDGSSAWSALPSASGYLPSNILGTVSQSGGTPTGAVIERGSNSNGHYTRWADGTQICWSRIDLTYSFGTRMRGTWTYPASFSDVPAPPAPSLVDPNQGTPHPRELGVIHAKAGLSSATVDLWRSDGGATAFDAADVYEADVLAIGRWF